MQAAKSAALVRAPLLERYDDETPAATMLTTTPNEALAHVELVHTYQPSRAVPRASACSTTLHVSLDGTHGDVASICSRDLAPLRQRAQSAGSRDGLQGQNGARARVRSSSVVQARLPVTSYVNDHRPAHLIETTGQFSPLSQVQVELKKGQTIMADANLKQSSSVLHEDVSDRSGLPADIFELYHGGKRLEREATLSSRGVGKDSTIEVKMRGRGGMPGVGMLPGLSGRGGSPDGGRRSHRRLAEGGGSGADGSDGVGGGGSGGGAHPAAAQPAAQPTVLRVHGLGGRTAAIELALAGRRTGGCAKMEKPAAGSPGKSGNRSTRISKRSDLEELDETEGSVPDASKVAVVVAEAEVANVVEAASSTGQQGLRFKETTEGTDPEDNTRAQEAATKRAPQQGSFRLERHSLTLYWQSDNCKYLQVKTLSHHSIEDLYEKEGRSHSGDAPPSFLGPRRARWIRWSMLIVGCGILIFGVFLGGLLFALTNSFSSEVAPSHVASNDVANRSTLEESTDDQATGICLVKHDVLLTSSLVRDEFMGTFFNASCIAENATGDPCDTSIAEEYVHRILAANRFSTLIVEFLAFLAMFAFAQVGGIPRPTNWSGMLCWLAWMVAQLAQYVVVLLMLVMEFFSFLSMRARLEPCLIRVDGAAMVDVVAHVSNLSLLTACPAI